MTSERTDDGYASFDWRSKNYDGSCDYERPSENAVAVADCSYRFARGGMGHRGSQRSGNNYGGRRGGGWGGGSRVAGRHEHPERNTPAMRPLKNIILFYLPPLPNVNSIPRYWNVRETLPDGSPFFNPYAFFGGFEPYTRQTYAKLNTPHYVLTPARQDPTERLQEHAHRQHTPIERLCGPISTIADVVSRVAGLLYQELYKAACDTSPDTKCSIKLKAGFLLFDPTKALPRQHGNMYQQQQQDKEERELYICERLSSVLNRLLTGDTTTTFDPSVDEDYVTAVKQRMVELAARDDEEVQEKASNPERHQIHIQKETGNRNKQLQVKVILDTPNDDDVFTILKARRESHTVTSDIVPLIDLQEDTDKTNAAVQKREEYDKKIRKDTFIRTLLGTRREALQRKSDEEFDKREAQKQAAPPPSESEITARDALDNKRRGLLLQRDVEIERISSAEESINNDKLLEIKREIKAVEAQIAELPISLEPPQRRTIIQTISLADLPEEERKEIEAQADKEVESYSLTAAALNTCKRYQVTALHPGMRFRLFSNAAIVKTQGEVSNEQLRSNALYNEIEEFVQTIETSKKNPGVIYSPMGDAWQINLHRKKQKQTFICGDLQVDIIKVTQRDKSSSTLWEKPEIVVSYIPWKLLFAKKRETKDEPEDTDATQSPSPLQHQQEDDSKRCTAWHPIEIVERLYDFLNDAAFLLTGKTCSGDDKPADTKEFSRNAAWKWCDEESGSQRSTALQEVRVQERLTRNGYFTMEARLQQYGDMKWKDGK